MPTLDPATGPVPREEFKTLADLPFGKAREAIQKHDPLWGVEDGTPIKWEVKFTRTVREEGWATVTAATEKEAEKLADKLPESQISWDCGDCDGDDLEIESIRPKKR